MLAALFLGSIDTSLLTPSLYKNLFPPSLFSCLCVNVVAYDYRGYGQSKFALPPPQAAADDDEPTKASLKLSERSVNEDLETIYAYVTLERRVCPEKVYLYGRSLGSAPAAHLASILSSSTPKTNIFKLANARHVKLFEMIRKWRAKPGEKAPLLGGLILQSPMKTCMKTKLDVGIDFFSKMSDCDEDNFDLFATQNYITSVECPIFIIHGKKDKIVPFSHGRFLYLIATRARNARWLVKEKKKLLHDKETDLMHWLMETKMKRKEAKRRREKEMNKIWNEANKEEESVRDGTEYAGGGLLKSPKSIKKTTTTDDCKMQIGKLTRRRKAPRVAKLVQGRPLQ